ncbi:MAG TPA: helix-turn-helix domain-containing protein [Bacillota bacterium]|nr:helix-turn-helix domain-containing protein [Bacillota bacterium]
MIDEALGAFQQATGLTVRFVPVDSSGTTTPANGLCALLTADPQGCKACRAALDQIVTCLRSQSGPCRTQCFAGLTELAAPVMVGGKPVALLLGGQVLSGPPDPRGCAALLGRVRRLGIQVQDTHFRAAYFQTRVASEAQLQAGAHLLWILAQHFAGTANPELLDGGHTEPLAVVRAKTFARAHLLEPVTTRDAAQATHLSLPHFCRLFKRSTGITFTAFLTRCRVQKARQLLSDFSLRITDVAFAAGFQSIPHFDHTFKRYTGQSPRQYRRGL